MKNSNEILTLPRANNIDRSMRKVTGSDWSRERKWQTKNTIKLGIKKSIISREAGVMMMPTSSGSRISQVGAPPPEFGVKTYYLASFLPKTAWKWKQLDREGGRGPSPLDPPMPITIALILFINWQKMKNIKAQLSVSSGMASQSNWLTKTTIVSNCDFKFKLYIFTNSQSWQ